MDGALKAVLLNEVSTRRPPEVPEEAVYCLAFLDNARTPPPRPPDKRNLEWKQLCNSMKAGRVKDPEPWVLPSLRGEFLLNPPDMRPFSQCKARSLLTQDEWERTRLVVVERMEVVEPGLINITLQTRSPCHFGEQWETTWGHAADCFAKRNKDGRWEFSNCALIVII